MCLYKLMSGKKLSEINKQIMDQYIIIEELGSDYNVNIGNRIRRLRRDHIKN